VSSFGVTTVDGIPEVTAGMNLGALIAAAAGGLADGDVVVISQKIVSKAEGRLCDLGVVEPTDRASELAAQVEKDPRVVELVLGESSQVIRATPGVLIVRTWSGLVCANAGIDASNVPGDDHVLLLPEDSDASARRIRGEIRNACERSPAVVIADSFGRAWRLGQTDVAIGCAGLEPIDDWRGRPDREGRELSATAIAVADQVAGAADLVRDKAAGTPVVLVRGLERHVTVGDGPGAAAIQRPDAEDLFS
jgi:coenzyme F420-0:L-glutamate ligase/coenzyme F420-1:gamma-L-glutamate ligase